MTGPMQEVNPVHSSRIALFAVPIALAVALTGCSSSKSADSSSSSGSSSSASADGDKAALCKFDTDANAAGTGATTAAGALAVLKSFDGQYDQVLAEAPAAIKADVQTLVTDSRKAVQTNDITIVQADSYTQAGMRLDAFCGIASSSTSSSTSSASPSPSDTGSSS